MTDLKQKKEKERKEEKKRKASKIEARKEASLTEFRHQICSVNLLTDLSLNCFLNGVVSCF